MEVIHRIIAGLDVHLAVVVACLRVQRGRKVTREERRFGTTVPELLKLLDWLVEAGCPLVIIESSGVYWKPVFNILESSLEVCLVNAYHAKAVAGYKTDRLDAARLADLGAHGLLRSSFIPPAPIRELREITRYRKSLVQAKTSEINRVEKVLEAANIKLSTVVSDIMGVSGRAMIRALIKGERDATKLAALAKGSLRGKIDELIPALTGRFAAGHGFLLGQILDHIEYLEGQIEAVSKEVARLCEPFHEAVDLLMTMPGAGRTTAEMIVAEIGVDMSRFPSPHHLASWAGVCPGNHETAGRRRSGRTRKGNRWLRGALAEAAWAATHAKGSEYQVLFRRLAFTRGKGQRKARVAVSHAMLIAAWHILKDMTPYRALAPVQRTGSDPTKISQALVKRLEKLGFTVTLEQKTAA
jgi:transposase